MGKFGDVIRQKREAVGMKVFELADKVGVNPVYITQIEKHGKLPSSEVMRKIGHLLGSKDYLENLYIAEKYEDTLEELWSKTPRWFHYKPVTLHTEMDEELVNDLYRYVFSTDDAQYNAFAKEVIKRLYPNIVNSEEAISFLAKNLKSVKDSWFKVLSNYNKLENGIIALVNKSKNSQTS